MIGLSICIPTYNRATSCLRLVNEILSLDNKNIEIVVLDNGSPDNTMELLSLITDSRLSVYSNGENRGALFNMINVLSKAKGKYLVYSTDQDFIDTSNITDFINFLVNGDNIACGYCRFSSEKTPLETFFNQGYEAVRNIAYLSRHPSGYFFNRELLEKTDYLVKFADYDFVDLFPFEFIFAELCMMGNAAIYNKQLNIPETTSNIVSKNKSSTTKGTSPKAFFSPTGRLKMAINYTNHATKLEINEYQIKTLIKDIFLRGLISATFGYKALLKNESLCNHYYIESRNMSNLELLKTTASFLNNFFSRVEYLKKYPIQKAYLIYSIFVSATSKLFKKIFK